MQDWLIKYTKDDKFHFDQLINDDYFVAIKLLFNARHLASACKLLVSCIDTLAFIEFGDERNNFASWLDDYVDLAPVGVTSTELWEFRNSIRSHDEPVLPSRCWLARSLRSCPTSDPMNSPNLLALPK